MRRIAAILARVHGAADAMEFQISVQIFVQQLLGSNTKRAGFPSVNFNVRRHRNSTVLEIFLHLSATWSWKKFLAIGEVYFKALQVKPELRIP